MIEHNEFQLALFNELQELQELKKKLEVSLAEAPAGSLHVLQKQGKAPQYYSYESRNKRKYISKKNMNLACGLAQKEYDQKLLIQVNDRIQYLLNLEKTYQTPLVAAYEEMSDTKKVLMNPYELSDEDFVKQWYNDHPGCMNTYPICTNFYSNAGIHVRSKSEKILADLFEKNGVPYIYEPCIKLKSGIVVYPDFLLLNQRLRKQYIYEHFGIMSDAQYADKTIEKLSLYQRNNYYLGINFLFDMESQNVPLDIRYIKELIEAYLK